jgi:hypothetical protein
MPNPADRSVFFLHQAQSQKVLLDHQMIVDGVVMRERKDLTKTLNGETGAEEWYLSHTRVIGDKSYTAKQSMTQVYQCPMAKWSKWKVDEDKEELIETEMDNSELENFKNEWEENPTIREVFGPPQNPSSDSDSDSSDSDEVMEWPISEFWLPWR